MAAIPESTRNSITLRLLDHAEAHWPELARVKVTYRGGFGYVTGVLRNGENIPLCRLRYGGSAHSFGFAIYSAAHDRYQDAVLELDRQHGPAGQRPERRLQAAPGKDRRVNPAGNRPHLVRYAREPLGDRRQLAVELAQFGRHRCLHCAQVQHQRHQLLLDAVVQITLDPPPGLVRGGHDPRAGGGQGGQALSVRDCRGDKLREPGETRFSVRGERLAVQLRMEVQNAPQPSLDEDRAGDRGADSQLVPYERGDTTDRIEALGGIFSLHSPEGGGTVVSCELPVPADGGQPGTGHGQKAPRPVDEVQVE